MPKIDIQIECKACQGTGLYSGMGEGKGIAVVCSDCNGSGKSRFIFNYEEFTGRKLREDIKRVYLHGGGYRLGLGVVNYEGVGKIDMDKEGVSYIEFVNGQHPKHIKQLGCPMGVDQGACHKIKGFTEKCNKLNGGWINFIPNCKHKAHSVECWERFENGTEKI